VNPEGSQKRQTVNYNREFLGTRNQGRLCWWGRPTIQSVSGENPLERGRYSVSLSNNVSRLLAPLFLLLAVTPRYVMCKASIKSCSSCSRVYVLLGLGNEMLEIDGTERRSNHTRSFVCWKNLLRLVQVDRLDAWGTVSEPKGKAKLHEACCSLTVLLNTESTSQSATLHNVFLLWKHKRHWRANWWLCT
jgi:hypothetical protein